MPQKPAAAGSTPAPLVSGRSSKPRAAGQDSEVTEQGGAEVQVASGKSSAANGMAAKPAAQVVGSNTVGSLKSVFSVTDICSEVRHEWSSHTGGHLSGLKEALCICN